MGSMQSGLQPGGGCWGNTLPGPRPLWPSGCVFHVVGSPGRDPFHEWNIKHPLSCPRVGGLVPNWWHKADRASPQKCFILSGLLSWPGWTEWVTGLCL